MAHLQHHHNHPQSSQSQSSQQQQQPPHLNTAIFDHRPRGIAGLTPPISVYDDEQKPMIVSESSKPKRKGGRSVSTLTPQQLERKRANDREAQRAIRARTKEHIERLEREIASLRSGQTRDEQMEHLVQRNQGLEEEIRRLRTILGLQSSPTSLPHRPSTPVAVAALPLVGSSSVSSAAAATAAVNGTASRPVQGLSPTLRSAVGHQHHPQHAHRRHNTNHHSNAAHHHHHHSAATSADMASSGLEDPVAAGNMTSPRSAPYTPSDFNVISEFPSAVGYSISPMVDSIEGGWPPNLSSPPLSSSNSSDDYTAAAAAAGGTAGGPSYVAAANVPPHMMDPHGQMKHESELYLTRSWPITSSYIQNPF